MKFEIPGSLPGMNEIIEAAKSHFGAYAKMKDEHTTAITWLAKKLPAYKRVVLVIHAFTSQTAGAIGQHHGRTEVLSWMAR